MLFLETSVIWRAIGCQRLNDHGEAMKVSELKGNLSCRMQKCASQNNIFATRDRVAFGVSRTGRQGLLELLGLLGVLEHQGVQVLLAADLELDVLGLLVLLDARGCRFSVSNSPPQSRESQSHRPRRRQSSQGQALGFSGVQKRTGGVLSAADLDELKPKVSIDDFFPLEFGCALLPIRTFLISATSRGILAVLCGLTEKYD